MSKRFTDTEKWKDEWFLELKKDDKLIWQYLLDNCTNAGRWKKSFKHLNFCCEVNMDSEKIKKEFDGRLIDKEGFFFIPKFLIFQYPNGLNSQKKALIAVVKELDKYGLREIVNKMFGDEFLSITNQSPIDTQSIQDKDKDKDMVKDKYLDFVFLTKKQHQELVNQFGLLETEERIKRLNEYGHQKPKKFKEYGSHYHTILVWARKDKPEAGSNLTKAQRSNLEGLKKTMERITNDKRSVSEGVSGVGGLIPGTTI